MQKVSFSEDIINSHSNIINTFRSWPQIYAKQIQMNFQTQKSNFVSFISDFLWSLIFQYTNIQKDIQEGKNKLK